MISATGLTKRYGGVLAVDDVSFVCRPGTVTGLLGPGGAGKSTTMRIITGLTRADRGAAIIGSLRYRDVPNPAAQVGVLPDARAQHAGRTGREVLALGALALGLPRSRVDLILDQVSLTAAESRRRIRTYSPGMRQRLGLAHALLGDPRVLILDEPASGLDPAGLSWLRGLLADFAGRGGTVLLSTRLLHEAGVIADHLLVIGKGRIVACGRTAQLLARPGTLVKGFDAEELAGVLAAAGFGVSRAGDGWLRTEATADEVGRAATRAGLALAALRDVDGSGLEEMYLELTAQAQRDTRVRG
jgi:ABC-2 type transport system ATP-binding protein